MHIGIFRAAMVLPNKKSSVLAGSIVAIGLTALALTLELVPDGRVPFCLSDYAAACRNDDGLAGRERLLPRRDVLIVAENSSFVLDVALDRPGFNR